jgi:tetratricopeptide (TPR) repeat protein
MPHFLLATACAHMGRREGATAAARKACELSGREARSLGPLARLYRLAGRQSEAQALLKEPMTRRRTTYTPPSAMELAYRGLGNMEQALDWLGEGGTGVARKACDTNLDLARRSRGRRSRDLPFESLPLCNNSHIVGYPFAIRLQKVCPSSAWKHRAGNQDRFSGGGSL